MIEKTRSKFEFFFFFLRVALSAEDRAGLVNALKVSLKRISWLFYFFPQLLEEFYAQLLLMNGYSLSLIEKPGYDRQTLAYLI